MPTEDHTESADFRIEQALSDMSDSDLARLFRKASYLLVGTGLNDAEELFNEAIKRTLEGRRKWPQHVAFGAYIWMVMESIADGQRNLVSRNTELLANDQLGWDDYANTDLMDQFGEDDLAVDKILEDAEARKKMSDDLDIIEQYFKDDQHVTLVLMGMEDKIPPRDLIDDYGITLTQYESARKKLRRGVDRLFPGRRTV